MDPQCERDSKTERQKTVNRVLQKGVHHVSMECSSQLSSLTGSMCEVLEVIFYGEKSIQVYVVI